MIQKNNNKECVDWIRQQTGKWTFGRYEELWERIREGAEPKYASFSAKLLPEVGRERVLGVRLPILRKYADAVSRGDSNSYLFIVREKAAKSVLTLEETLVWSFVIGHLKEWNVVKQEITAFVPYIDNWSVNDSFCASLKITKKRKEEMYEFLSQYLESERTYDQRFAFVMLLNYYIEPDYLERIFNACELQEWQDYYTKMAVAWLISMCYVEYKPETEEYLMRCRLDDFTYNKAIQKIIESRQVTKEEKQKLRTWKRQ